MSRELCVIGVVCIAMIVGCATNPTAPPPPFQPASVTAGRPANPTDPGSNVDRPGALQRDPDEPVQSVRRPAQASAAPAPSVGALVQENVKSPYETAMVTS